MQLLMYNSLLALNWMLLNGEVSLLNLCIGYVLGYGLLWLLRPLFSSITYFDKIHKAITFGFFFLWELFRANINMVRLVLFKPNRDIHPAIIALPLKAETDAEIALLANLISLTPGTLSLDVSSDQKVLYIHAIDVTDVDKLREELQKGLEARLLEVMR